MSPLPSAPPVATLTRSVVCAQADADRPKTTADVQSLVRMRAPLSPSIGQSSRRSGIFIVVEKARPGASFNSYPRTTNSSLRQAPRPRPRPRMRAGLVASLGPMPRDSHCASMPLRPDARPVGPRVLTRGGGRVQLRGRAARVDHRPGCTGPAGASARHSAPRGGRRSRTLEPRTGSSSAQGRRPLILATPGCRCGAQVWLSRGTVEAASESWSNRRAGQTR